MGVELDQPGLVAGEDQLADVCRGEGLGGGWEEIFIRLIIPGPPSTPSPSPLMLMMVMLLGLVLLLPVELVRAT